MINEDRVEQAIKNLASTDEEHANLKAEFEYLKDTAKKDKAIFIVNLNEKQSFSFREQLYYASKEYDAHIANKRIVLKDLTHLENKRAKEGLVIEVWRTLEASRRKNNIT